MENSKGFREAVYADLYLLQLSTAKMYIACNVLSDKEDAELLKEIQDCNREIQQSAKELNQRLQRVTP